MGHESIARVGEGGFIALTWHDEEADRPRITVGYVGENIDADTWYMERKAFQVVMRKIEMRINEQTVTVYAESEEDARVLAKYEDLAFYLWTPDRNFETVGIAAVKPADDPLTHYGSIGN
ncbi:MAG: hypothetical protein ACN6PF_27695 [Achromobacter veterisilvae]